MLSLDRIVGQKIDTVMEESEEDSDTEGESGRGDIIDKIFVRKLMNRFKLVKAMVK